MTNQTFDAIPHREPFFSTQMRKMRLGVEAHGWLGTPFVAHGHVRGAGVDCVHLGAEIYVGCGVFESYQFPRYTLDGGAHLDTSLVLKWLDEHPIFLAVMLNRRWLSEGDRPHAGDTVVVKLKKVEHHIGLMITDEIGIHIVERRRVESFEVADPTFKNALTHVYRPMEAVK